MPFQRIATVLLAATISSSTVLSEDGQNPFAQWDKISRQTSAALSNVESQKTAKPSGNLEYFSPDNEARDNGKQNTANAGVTRERLRLKRPTTETAEKTKPQDSAVKNAPKRHSGTASVQNAGFSTSNKTADIKQVNAEIFGEGGAENPFAEFLGDTSGDENETAVELISEPEQSQPITQPNFDTVVGLDTDTPVLPKSLQGPQTPTVTVQWLHHDDFSVGQECRSDLVVENTGRSAVRNVVLEAVLPKGLQVVAATPSPGTMGASASWAFSELAPGQKQTVQLNVVPQQQGELQFNAFVQFTGATASTVAITQPMVAIKLTGPPVVEVGQQLAYTVHVTNPGSGKARNVTIQAVVPKGLEHRQGSLLTIDIGTLNPGEQRRARLSLTAVKGGEHDLAVRVIAEGGLQEQTQQMVSVAEPRLNIGLRGPAKERAGQNCEYEIVVVNEGNVDSNNVRAKYQVPEGYEFIQAAAGGKFNPADRTIEWFVGTLEANKLRNFSVTLRATTPAETVHQVGVISEHGRMTTADHSTVIIGSAKLSLNVAAAQKRLRSGEETEFEVQVVNNGTSAAESVGLSCELPPALELVDVSGPSEFIADNGVVIFRSLPVLEPGTPATFKLRVRCQREGSHKLRVRVASESIPEPLIGEDTTVCTP